MINVQKLGNKISRYNINSLKFYLFKYFSNCGTPVLVAWCSDDEDQIYEVDNLLEFETCSNIPDTPYTFQEKGVLNAFLLRPGERSTRYFVSKKNCDKGFKVQVELSSDCPTSFE